MAKQIIDLGVTGKVIGNLTWSWCKQISDNADVSTAAATLTERGNGIYVLDITVTEPTDFRVYVTADPTKYAVGIFSLVDGDEAKESTLQTGVRVLPAQIAAGVLADQTTVGDLIEWPRGDAGRLTVELGSTYAKAGAKFYLCIKAVKTAADTSAIVNAEITITDADNVAGYIDLTAVQMATVGSYFAEIERRDSDGTSNPRTCWQAVWSIKQDVRLGT